MRAIQFAVCGILTLALSGSVAQGQAGRGAAPPTTLGGIALRVPAPTDKAVDWQAASLDAAFKEMVEKKLETSRILVVTNGVLIPSETLQHASGI